MSPIFDKVAFRRLRRLCGFKQPLPRIGRKTFIDRSAQFLGSELIEIGDRCIISEGCWFNVSDRTGNTPRIVIGDHCLISRRTFLSAGSKITINPYCVLGSDTNILGADHDFSDPFKPYLVPYAISGREVVVGTNTWIGSGCTILKGVSIGRGSVIGAASVVSKPIPPFSVAVGNPCRVQRRFRMRDLKWVSISEWTAEDEEQLPCDESYLEKIREHYEWIPMPYIVAGHRLGNI